MKLMMTTSLGIADARRLDVAGAREGEAVEAPPEVAEELVRRGWAVAVAVAPEAPPEVPPEVAVAVAPPPSQDAPVAPKAGKPTNAKV